MAKKFPSSSTGSFDKLEVLNIVPRPTPANTEEKRITLGGDGDTIVFPAGSIVEGLDYATTGNAPDLTDYYNKEAIDGLLVDKEDVTTGDTHALQADMEALNAEDIAAFPKGLHIDNFTSPSGLDITQQANIETVAGAVAYNLELIRQIGNNVVSNATSTDYVEVIPSLKAIHPLPVVSPNTQSELNNSFNERAVAMLEHEVIQEEHLSSIDASLDEKATIEYVDDADSELVQGIESNHEDLQTIRLELEALAPTLATGNWNYTTSPGPRQGEINVGTNTYTSITDKVILHDNDADGSTHGFANVQVGSFIELIDSDDQYGLYEITNKAPGTGLFEFDVELVRGLGAPADGDLVTIRVFDVTAVNPESLDSKVNKAGDIMTGDLEVEGRIHAHNMIDMNSTKIINVSEPTTNAGAATKGYVDALDSKYLSKTGSTEQTVASKVTFNGYAYLNREPSGGNGIQTRAMVQKLISDNASTGIEIGNSSTPPSNRPKGSMYMTSNNKLYVYIA